MMFNQMWGSPLIRGPNPLEEEKKKEFEKFWGPKAHLRKFKDGSLAVSVRMLPNENLNNS